MALRDVGTVKDTTVITLYHPASGKDLLNADGSPMTVTVHGPYSERYKSIMRAQQQRRMTDTARVAGRGAVEMSPEELEAFSHEMVTRSVETWNITLDGDAPLPFSIENVESVFKEFPWVRDQIMSATGNVSNFLDSSKTP